uniref:Uncharacterized protein n=1 Tax=Molossus molossus TaxID=27622 RepID=A0A7J8F9N2_MOLMO|nr:hypothetical protein HJG59_008617 [Molossus molossus]
MQQRWPRRPEMLRHSTRRLPCTSVPGQCLPARAPGSGHRPGDCQEPLSPGPEMFPFLWSASPGTLPVPWSQWTVPRVRLGGTWQRGRGLRSRPPSLPPQAASLSPPSHALPRPCHCLLGPLTRPAPGTHRCRWSPERLALRARHPRPRTGAVDSWGVGFC